MANEVKIVISAVGKGIKETTNSLISGLDKSVKAMQTFNKSVTSGKDIASGLTNQIKGLIGAYAGISAISSAVDLVKDSETAFYNLKSSVEAANREFGNIGSLEDWESTITRLSDELVIYSDTALANAISKTVDMTKRLGLSKDQMEEVIQRSADLGAGKFELSDSVERVTAALRGEAEASEALGLTLSETYVKGWFEANDATKKAWKDLTDVEKAQVRYQVLLEQSAALHGRAAGSAETFSGAIQLVKKEIENAVVQNKDLVTAMNELAQVLRDNAGEIGTFISQLISGAAKLVEFAVKYKEVLAVIAGTAVTVSVVSKLVSIFNGLNAAFVVLTGSGIVGFIGSLRTAIAAAATSTTALGVAFQGLVALAAAQGVVNIIKAANAFLEMRDAQDHAKESQENLFKTIEKVKQKFAEFKDVKLPDDITGTAPDELEELRQGLQKSKAYWTALQIEMSVKSEETMLGVATEEAIEAQAQLKIANQRLAEIDSGLAKIKTSGEAAGEGMAKPTESIKATKEQLDEFEKQATAAYQKATEEAKKYADEVIAWEEKIRDAKLSTEDKLRELSRETMTDEQEWNDERLQADEKLYAAKEALRNGDYDLAEKLAKEAEGLYAGLAKEIKSSTEEGDKAIVKSLESTVKVAKTGVQTVGDFMVSLYGKQKENAQASQQNWEKAAAEIKKKLDEISNKKITIEVDTDTAKSKLNAFKAQLDSIQSKTITVTTVHKTVEQKQTGGPVGFARGGRLPGYGGGDRIRALLEAGEFVIRKEAVSKYGAGLFHALNAMKADFPNMIKARVGGLISNLSIPSLPVQKFAAGGIAMAGGASETLVVRFQAGDIEAPVKITDRDSRMAMKQLAKEMSRMRMVYSNV